MLHEKQLHNGCHRYVKLFLYTNQILWFISTSYSEEQNFGKLFPSKYFCGRKNDKITEIS